jgi:hypothetical protein
MVIGPLLNKIVVLRSGDAAKMAPEHERMWDEQRRYVLIAGPIRSIFAFACASSSGL